MVVSLIGDNPDRMPQLPFSTRNARHLNGIGTKRLLPRPFRGVTISSKHRDRSLAMYKFAIYNPRLGPPSVSREHRREWEPSCRRISTSDG
jgi:hypothetical protein